MLMPSFMDYIESNQTGLQHWQSMQRVALCKHGHDGTLGHDNPDQRTPALCPGQRACVGL